MDVFKNKFRTKYLMALKNTNPPPPHSSPKSSKSFASTTKRLFASPKTKRLITVEQGYFTVYVGPEKEQFLVKTKSVNHPLFRSLLNAAKTEYRFTGDDPIQLPCDVDLFFRALAEMGSGNGGEEGENGGNNVKCCTPLVIRSPACQPSDLISGKTSYGYKGSYRILASPSFLKLNR